MTPREPLGDTSAQEVSHAILGRIGAIFSNWWMPQHLKLGGYHPPIKVTINIVVAPRESWVMKPREPLGDNSTQGVGHSILWRIGAIYSN